MTRIINRLLAAALCSLLPALIYAASPQDTLRILWIGNSYTFYNNLPDVVSDIAASQKMRMKVTRVVKGGERLSGHWQNPQLHELLEQGGWNYVVVQEYSSATAYSTSYVVSEVYPYAHKIDSMAMAHSPEAKVIFYMTWGHKNGNLRQTDYPLDDTYLQMQERVKLSYLEMAYDNHAWCAPVGMAWQTVRREHPEYDLYTADNFHPSLLGSYLAANVIFSTIYQRKYQTSVTCGLAPQIANTLQQTAQKTVLSNLQLLNIRPKKPIAKPEAKDGKKTENKDSVKP